LSCKTPCTFDAHHYKTKLIMMKQPALGQKILALRQQKGLTQEELVEQCNISVRTIQRIEAGETMPRIYTIKTILSALDRDLDDLREDTLFEAKIKQAMFIEIDDSKHASFLTKHLHIGWIAGVLSMLAFIFQVFEEYNYINKEIYFLGNNGYIVLSIFTIVSFFFHMRAFLLIGNLFKMNFVKIAAIVLIVVETIMNLITIIDIHRVYVPDVAYGIIGFVLYGIGFLLFGYALYKLHSLGNLSKVTGIAHLITGGLFLTIILGVIALPLSILLQVLSIAIILKVIEIIKQPLNE